MSMHEHAKIEGPHHLLQLIYVCYICTSGENAVGLSLLSVNACYHIVQFADGAEDEKEAAQDCAVAAARASSDAGWEEGRC